MKSFNLLAIPVVVLATLAVAHDGDHPLPPPVISYLTGTTVVVVQASDSTLSTTLQPATTGPAASFTVPFGPIPTDSSIILTPTSSYPITEVTPSASSTVTEVSVVSSTSVDTVSSTLVSSTSIFTTGASTSMATIVSSSTAVGAGATPTMGAGGGLLIGVAAGVLAIL